MNAAKVLGMSAPLTINSGATLATAGNQLTFGGNFVNNGTFNAGGSAIIITNTMASQSIDGFTTTGTVSMTKTGGTATFAGNVNGNALTFNGNGGTLNLGAGLTHTFTGTWTRTNGTLNGGSSTINFSRSGTVFSGTTGTFTASTGTVIYSYAGAQTVPVLTYNNLTLSGSGIKSFGSSPTVTGILSMEGTATANVSGGAITYGASATLQYNTATSRTASSEEWISSFNGTGGVIIANTGAITIAGAKLLNESVPLTINSGATLATVGFQLSLGGNFVNHGTFSAGGSDVLITLGMDPQSIDGFTTTGIVSMTKTLSSTATFTGNVNGGNLVMNGSNNSHLDLGSGNNHNFTGTWVRTNGTLNGGSSTINFSRSGTVFSGTGGSFSADLGTVNYSGVGPQQLAALTYNNLTLSGTGAKTTTGITVTGILSMEGTATASDLPTYGAGATLIYEGSAAQTTGAEFPAVWAGTGGVKIENASGVTLGAARSLGARTLYIGSIVSNSVFSDGGFQLTATGTLNLTSGTFKLGAATATIFPAFASTNISAGTTVEYAATTTQTVKGITYSNLSISGTGTNSKTADANITVNGILNLSSANASVTQGALSMSTFTLTMGAAATTIGTGDVTGIVSRSSFVLNTPYSFGSQYSTLTFSEGPFPANVSIKTILSAAEPSWMASTGIHRYYDIVQTGADDNTMVTLNLRYLDSELHDATEGSLDLFDYHVGTPGTLTDDSYSNFNSTDNWVGLENLHLIYAAPGSSFGVQYWTIGTSTTATHTWYGKTSNDWTIDDNWTGRVPGSGDKVVIPNAATTQYDPTLPPSTTIGSVLIMPHAILNGGSGTSLNLDAGSGSWYNRGTFNKGTCTVTFSNSNDSLYTTTDFYSIIVGNGASLTIGTNDTLQIEGALSVLGTGVLNARTNPNTVIYKGSDQAVIAPNGAASGYYNLILSGTGTKTLPGTAVIIANDLTLEGSASVIAGNSMSIERNVNLASGTAFNASSYAHTIKGDWINNGASFTPGTSNITFNNTSVSQEIKGSAASQTFNTITVAKAGRTISVGGSTTSLTLNGDLTITSGTFDKGTASTINIAGNISNNGTFTAGAGTVVLNGSSEQTISGNNTDLYDLSVTNTAGVRPLVNVLTAHDLTIGTGSKFKINPGKSVTVHNALANNSGGASGLVLESDDASNASLIQPSAGIPATVHRYMTKGAWHIVSIPTSGQAIGSFVTNPANFIGYSSSLGTWAMMPYSPALNSWGSYYTGGESSSFNVGEGYMVHRKNSGEHGIVASSGSLDGETVNLSDLTAGKWNCIGNPYTSGIGVTASSLSVSDFLSENAANLDLDYGAIYIWDEQPGYTGASQRSDYVAINNNGYVAGIIKNVLQVGQGFLVDMAHSSTSLTFTPEMKIHQVGEPYLKKSASSWPGFELFATANAISSRTIVTYFEGMTKGLDPTFDAGVLKGNPNLALYTRLVDDNGTDIAIQCLPLEGVSSFIIPVGIDFPSGGEITFTSRTELIPAGSSVILEDRVTGIFTDLVANPSGYIVNLPASTKGIGRFFLHTGDGKVNTNISPDENYQVYNVGRKIYLNGETTPEALISLYSIQGVLIKVFTSDGSVHQQFDANGITEGIYLLSIIDKQKKRTYKLFL
jgi:hypothetical protein